MSTNFIRRVAFPTLLSALLLTLTGCLSIADGPSPTDPLSVTTTTVMAETITTVTLEQGLADYRGCLAERGVPIGEVQLDGRGRPRMALAMSELDFSDRVVLEALNACASELSNGALDLSADPALRDLVQSGLEDLAACLRRLGVDGYPDPVTRFDGLGSPYPVDRIPWSDPDLGPAVAACSRRLGASSS